MMIEANTNYEALATFFRTAPEEMLCEIISFIPFRDMIHMFLLSKHYYELLINSEVLFHKLCLVFCKINDIPLSVIDHQMKLLLKNDEFNNNKNHNNQNNITNLESNIEHQSIRNYLQVLKRIIRMHGYSWDTEFTYYQNSTKYSTVYTCDERTLCVLEKPSHGDFVTVKARKLLIPGHVYSWRFDLESYKPEQVSNGFKVMLGVESLDFFPFGEQSSGDVIAWQSASKGCALILGPKEVIRSACSDKTDATLKLQTMKSDEYTEFQTGDSIIVEFDFRVKIVTDPQAEAFREKYRKKLNTTCRLEKYFSGKQTITSGDDARGKIRFSLLRKNHFDGDKPKIHRLTEWLEFGESRFAPYVPACSVNKHQSISIHPNFYDQ
ncbi:hypothetical protein C9374_008503 [Naegleria lovaniensis]|uniref:F-box domain-containing protein n=1 Tax=Naegleria lovaniensis TaxID=51637 RepID=A0AA88GJR3_NAELO|nr:uncharacterized protein C9374_008503 [Naegleria lovaniensis]KAG2378360.1 hypothetical protein C9374_008503 [Naegleria lovaniensis]